MSPAALVKITTYAFPGNIRELRNLLERAHILRQGDEIGECDLPAEVSGAATPTSEKMEMRDWLRTLPASVDLRELLAVHRIDSVLCFQQITAGVSDSLFEAV